MKKPKKKLTIDPDILASALDYVNQQLDTMRKYEACAEISEDELHDLVYRVALYPQKLRNLSSKIDRRLGKNKAKSKGHR